MNPEHLASIHRRPQNVHAEHIAVLVRGIDDVHGDSNLPRSGDRGAPVDAGCALGPHIEHDRHHVAIDGRTGPLRHHEYLPEHRPRVVGPRKAQQPRIYGTARLIPQFQWRWGAATRRPATRAVRPAARETRSLGHQVDRVALAAVLGPLHVLAQAAREIRKMSIDQSVAVFCPEVNRFAVSPRRAADPRNVPVSPRIDFGTNPHRAQVEPGMKPAGTVFSEARRHRGGKIEGPLVRSRRQYCEEQY